MSIRKFIKEGLTFIQIENSEVSAVFLPEIGGKMTELTNKLTGRQFLMKPQKATSAYRPAFYGANFEEYDTSGFDECFPTIEESSYRFAVNDHRSQKIVFPDHGELWSAAWRYRTENNKLILEADGIQFPYHLEKQVHLNENKICLNYYLKNNAQVPLAYIWSAHPLLYVRPGVQLLTADRIDEVFINWASDSDFARYGDIRPWPYLSPEHPDIDYSLVQDKMMGLAIKCFTEPLIEGLAGIYDHENDESLVFQFDPQQLPYLGLWLCYGGWPVTGEHKHLTVGIEPASGRPDSLMKAIQRNEFSQVAAGDVNHWTLILSVWKGKPNKLSNTQVKN